MLSSVLNSERSVQVNILIMRAFVKLRQILVAHKELSLRLDELERESVKHDAEIKTIFEAIQQLAELPAEPPPEQSKKAIGFHP